MAAVRRDLGGLDDPARIRRGDDALHLDVRGLMPPEPMVAILRLIEGGGAGDMLIVHLDREPIFLYPELDQRGWRHDILPASGNPLDESAVVLRLRRMAP